MVAEDLSKILHMSKEEAYEMRGVLKVMSRLRKGFTVELLNYVNTEADKHNSRFVSGGSFKAIETLDLNDLEMFID